MDRDETTGASDGGVDERREAVRGAYALGHLEVEERRQVETHLETCTSCQRQLDELGPAVRLLHSGRPRDLDAAPPAALEDRIVSAVDRHRPQAATPALLGAAAAVLAVFALGVGAVLPRGDRDPPQLPVELASVRPGIEVDAGLVAHTWGTEVVLQVSGLVAGATYEVALHDQRGVVHDAGTFLGVDDRPVDCRLNAAVLVPDVERIVVTDRAGAEVIVASA